MYLETLARRMFFGSYLSNASGSAWLQILLTMDLSFKVEKPHRADGIDRGTTIEWTGYCWGQSLFMISARSVLGLRTNEAMR